MTNTHTPSDALMTAHRLAGRFICGCNMPQPVLIGAWSSYECRSCGKLYLGHTRVGEELIRLVVEELA